MRTEIFEPSINISDLREVSPPNKDFDPTHPKYDIVYEIITNNLKNLQAGYDPESLNILLSAYERLITADTNTSFDTFIMSDTHDKISRLIDVKKETIKNEQSNSREQNFAISEFTEDVHAICTMTPQNRKKVTDIINEYKLPIRELLSFHLDKNPKYPYTINGLLTAISLTEPDFITNDELGKKAVDVIDTKLEQSIFIDSLDYIDWVNLKKKFASHSFRLDRYSSKFSQFEYFIDHRFKELQENERDSRTDFKSAMDIVALLAHASVASADYAAMTENGMVIQRSTDKETQPTLPSVKSFKL